MELARDCVATYFLYVTTNNNMNLKFMSRQDLSLSRQILPKFRNQMKNLCRDIDFLCRDIDLKRSIIVGQKFVATIKKHCNSWLINRKVRGLKSHLPHHNQTFQPPLPIFSLVRNPRLLNQFLTMSEPTTLIPNLKKIMEEYTELED